MRHRFWRYRFKSEAPSIRFLRNAPLSGCTLIDVGANKGIYSYYMSRQAGPAGAVLAFEAQPELIPHLEALKASFHLDNLTVVPHGLSSRPGTLTLRRAKAGSGMAGFPHRGDAALEALPVPVTTLDDYLTDTEAQLPAVRFVKCDVEGHELDVFKGGQKLLETQGPALMFECHDRAAREGRLFAWLVSLGYDGWFFQVDPRHHRSVVLSGRGRWLHHSCFAGHPYPRPGVRHRNYLFLTADDPLRPLLAAA